MNLEQRSIISGIESTYECGELQIAKQKAPGSAIESSYE
jgi:hypothetical protein